MSLTSIFLFFFTMALFTKTLNVILKSFQNFFFLSVFKQKYVLGKPLRCESGHSRHSDNYYNGIFSIAIGRRMSS